MGTVSWHTQGDQLQGKRPVLLFCWRSMCMVAMPRLWVATAGQQECRSQCARPCCLCHSLDGAPVTQKIPSAVFLLLILCAQAHQEPGGGAGGGESCARV